MLEPILGNKVVEKVLLYILNYGDAYARGIARTFNGVQQQIKRLENGGVIAVQNKENVRLYNLIPVILFLKNLRRCCRGCLMFYPKKRLKNTIGCGPGREGKGNRYKPSPSELHIYRGQFQGSTNAINICY
ncbi:MAG: hypothetical protein JW871_03330 [Endomicrobiales bacterium]|nr:hypothetical protein [Endomicrobiales bacterium]